MCSCSVLLSETDIKKARKQYYCGASEFLRDIPRTDMGDILNFAEKRLWIDAIRRNYKINVGDAYFRQVQVGDDGMFIFRALPGLHQICLKYDLYPECC